MRCHAIVFLALALSAAFAPVSAQVTADLHTTPRPYIVTPEQGQQRILPDGRALMLKVRPSTTSAAYLFLGSEDIPPGTAVPRHRSSRAGASNAAFSSSAGARAK
jgi:hypothetical protein